MVRTLHKHDTPAFLLIFYSQVLEKAMIGQKEVRTDLRPLIIRELDQLNSQPTPGSGSRSCCHEDVQYPSEHEQNLQKHVSEVVNKNYLRFIKEMYPDAILDAWHESSQMTYEELKSMEAESLGTRKKNKMILDKVLSMPLAMIQPFLKGLLHAGNNDLVDLFPGYVRNNVSQLPCSLFPH